MAQSPVTPTLGRIVILHGSMRDYAAVVSGVDEHNPAVVTLHVFDPTAVGIRVVESVSYGMQNVGGYRWSWPQKVG